MRTSFWTLFQKMRELRRNEHLTRAELEVLKLKKFRRLAKHASLHSPYYAKIVRDYGINVETCIPTDFPVLTKPMLMANFDSIAVDRRITKQAVTDFMSQSTDPNDLFLDTYRAIHTSGSSGEVGYFVYSKKDWARGFAQQLRIRARPAGSVRRKEDGKFRIAFYGAVHGHFAGVTMTNDIVRGFGRFFANMRLFEVNSPLQSMINELNDFQPEYVIGYTGALKILAQKQNEGILRIAPVGLNSVGEGMSTIDRDFLQKSFGCDNVTNRYACSENLTMGYATAGSNRMVLRDDDLIYEHHDDHTVVTNLFNYTLPLIRYRMSDVHRPVEQSGQSSPYIEISSVVGRMEEMPIFTNDQGNVDSISPFTIAMFFFPGVTGFQMQRQSNTFFRFAVCLDQALTPNERLAAISGVEHRLREILDQKNMRNVTFKVDVVSELPLNPKTRKFQLIVNTEHESNVSVPQQPHLSAARHV